MDLVLEIAKNNSNKVGSTEEFDGNFEPLVVHSSIVGAVEHVFEQTSEVGTGTTGIPPSGRDVMDSLERLKEGLKPVLDFNNLAVRKKNGFVVG